MLFKKGATLYVLPYFHKKAPPGPCPYYAPDLFRAEKNNNIQYFKPTFMYLDFYVEKRATLPLIFLSRVICLRPAGCISVKFLQIPDVQNTIGIVYETQPKFS